MRPRGYLLLPLLGLAAIACGGEGEAGRSAAVTGDDERPTATPTTARREPTVQSRAKRRRTSQKSQPSIAILRPRAGRQVRGPAVTVAVAVKGFEVVDQRVRPPFPKAVSGKGHVHFYLDTQKLPSIHGRPSAGTYRSLSTTTYTWPDVAPGRHTFAVQLVGKDHAPLRPQVEDRVTLRVR